MTAVLVGCAIASGVLHIAADYRGARRLAYAFKPLTIALLIASVAIAPGADGVFAALIAAGLALSMAGDIFLMLPRDHFMAGLVSFLAAHVVYVVAFSRGVPLGRSAWTFVPYLLLAGVLLTILWPRLGRLRVPVVIYVAVLIAMAGQAASRAVTMQTTPAIFAAAGGALFVASDAILAVNRFHRPFRAAQALIMSTYVAAQSLIALSV